MIFDNILQLLENDGKLNIINVYLFIFIDVKNKNVSALL